MLGQAKIAWQAHGSLEVICQYEGQGGVPSLRGKLLEAHTGISENLAMRLPRKPHGYCPPSICGNAQPSTLLEVVLKNFGSIVKEGLAVGSLPVIL